MQRIYFRLSRVPDRKNRLFFLKKIHPQTVRFDAWTNLFFNFYRAGFLPENGIYPIFRLGNPENFLKNINI